MNIIDIIIAKKKSFTGETESLVRRANEAMEQANTVAQKIEDAEVALSAASEAQEAAEAASALATEASSSVSSALNQLQNAINNLPSGGNTGGGNISGDISSADKGSIVAVSDNGNITPSSITETDLIKTQILAGSYSNENVVGLEIDYTNKTFTKLQGAKYASPGNNFNKFNMFGGRKRCIVNENGSIERFVTSEDTISTLVNKRIMVYQPAFYYFRMILSTTTTNTGVKIDKEQIYLSDKKIAGFKLHPRFKDANGNPVKYILLPAFESGTLRANGSYVTNDAQDINFSTDKLVSIVNTKPISGVSQSFNYAAAKQMAENNGTGWKLMDLEAFSINQMLMMIEYGSLNLQQTFNAGVTQITTSSSGNISANTGATVSLNNTSGQAASTINNINGSNVTYNTTGYCDITYRGTENPYGNIWKIIGDLFVQGNTYTYKNHDISFKIPAENGWINGFGYDPEMDWAYLPIEVNLNANSSLPVGDYTFIPDNNVQNMCVIGGLSNSDTNAGPFYYGLHINKENNYRSVSAQVIHTPVAGSTIETNNYNLWVSEE